MLAFCLDPGVEQDVKCELYFKEFNRHELNTSKPLKELSKKSLNVQPYSVRLIMDYLQSIQHSHEFESVTITEQQWQKLGGSHKEGRQQKPSVTETKRTSRVEKLYRSEDEVMVRKVEKERYSVD